MEENQKGYKRLARIMYDDYYAGVGGVAYNGDKLPSSEYFFNDPTKEKQINGWIATAKPLYDKLLKATQNLGHPAYGQSSSTTIGIDELRDEMFNFLGIGI